MSGTGPQTSSRVRRRGTTAASARNGSATRANAPRVSLAITSAGRRRDPEAVAPVAVAVVEHDQPIAVGHDPRVGERLGVPPLRGGLDAGELVASVPAHAVRGLRVADAIARVRARRVPHPPATALVQDARARDVALVALEVDCDCALASPVAAVV